MMMYILSKFDFLGGLGIAYYQMGQNWRIEG